MALGGNNSDLLNYYDSHNNFGNLLLGGAGRGGSVGN